MTSGRGAGRRRRARELALRVLFELDGAPEKGTADALQWQAEELGAATDVHDFAAALVEGWESHREAIDATLVEASTNWDLEDIGKVERAVLRLGTYELMHQPQTPVAVVIDESLELTRAYAGEEAVQFVNGVLGHVARSAA